MKVYLAGPMTGFPDFNYPAFHAATERLRALGYEVVSPAESFGGDTSRPRSDYMRQDLESLLTVDAVVTLPGWYASKGAALEVQIARELGLPVFDEADVGSVYAVPAVGNG